MKDFLRFKLFTKKVDRHQREKPKYFVPGVKAGDAH